MTSITQNYREQSGKTSYDRQKLVIAIEEEDQAKRQLDQAIEELRKKHAEVQKKLVEAGELTRAK